ncbi:hypothetical protein CP10139811_0087 [Chlamydia ibidis]|uniref:Uncharacterized protein n=2 Tax=Chlamydia ibidis TaxID=1405396 RepID=S7J5D8_9CHLA|nr:hypothetical protein CP10139811_0087 [Chlamydia ibidis]EQM62682.1 hypothetical protein H359_0530 [Chlamydia ibidis 10-1398/6]
MYSDCFGIYCYSPKNYKVKKDSVNINLKKGKISLAADFSFYLLLKIFLFALDFIVKIIKTR